MGRLGWGVDDVDFGGDHGDGGDYGSGGRESDFGGIYDAFCAPPPNDGARVSGVGGQAADDAITRAQARRLRAAVLANAARDDLSEEDTDRRIALLRGARIATAATDDDAPPATRGRPQLPCELEDRLRPEVRKE
jgi:hypothetical protein